MGLTRLEHLLEHADQAPFYDLMGGLADNLLTIGTYAGTFLACSACGHTFTLKGESWKCEHCGQGYEVKFRPSDQRGTPFETMVKVSGLTKPRWNPHWYYDNENWSVAEFLTQILRLRAEEFLGPWFRQLDVPIDPASALETVLCWPRFRFGGKTIQPDMAVGFQHDIILVEFKRPAGGTTPPVEVMGQLCFAAKAGRQLGWRWHIVLVPGPDSTSRTSIDYAREVLAAVSEAQSKWAIPAEALADIQSTPPAELAGRLRVLGWESLLRLSSEAIRASVPESWTRQQTLTKLRFFHTSRAALGLFAPLAGE
jgi:DNA-directed RNA polymerase subunit RPC12/RpoP